jgi:hypothetical protein
LRDTGENTQTLVERVQLFSDSKSIIHTFLKEKTELAPTIRDHIKPNLKAPTFTQQHSKYIPC